MSRPESSTARILGLLDLFTPQKPIWTVDELIATQGLTRATLYRYIKELSAAGLIAPMSNGGYGLGPRFVEVDRQIRMGDPLLQVAPSVMSSVREQVNGAQLLCRYYGERVLTIYRDVKDERLPPIMSMERGRPFSLFMGAPSRIILANLPAHQLQRLYLYHPNESSKVDLGNDWVTFRDTMRVIRKQGYAVASDIDKSLYGISAPIFSEPDVVIASICFVRLKKEISEKNHESLATLVTETARKITEDLRLATDRAVSEKTTNANLRNKPEKSIPALKKRKTK